MGGTHYFTGSRTKESPISPPTRRGNGPSRFRGRGNGGSAIRSGTYNGSGPALPPRIPLYDQKIVQDWPNGGSPPTGPKAMRLASTSLPCTSLWTQGISNGPDSVSSTIDPSRSSDSQQRGVVSGFTEQISNVDHSPTSLLPRPAVKNTGAVTHAMNSKGGIAAVAGSGMGDLSPQCPFWMTDGSKSMNSETTSPNCRSRAATSSIIQKPSLKMCHTCNKSRMTDEDPPWVKCIDCKHENHPSCCEYPVIKANAAQ